MPVHRLKASGDVDIPENVLSALTRGFPVISEAAASCPDLVSKEASAVCCAVEKFLAATTPEHRLRCVSQIAGTLCEAVFLDQRRTAECREFLHKLALHFVFPLMLHNAVRYLHRALASLIRSVYVMDEELERCFHGALVTSLIDCWVSGNSGQPTIFDGPAAVVLTDAKTLLQLKQPVMSWINSIGSTVTITFSLFFQVFTRTFLDIFPLLGESLQWVVANACMGCRLTDASDASSGKTPLGEDLMHVRHGIRVIATYTHRFLHLLMNILNDGDATKIAMVKKNMVKFLSPALAMLSLPVFPKDVLNAAGLLVASLLTVRTCDSWLLLEVCRLCSTRDVQTSAATTTPNANVDACLFMLGLETPLEKLVQLVCSDDPQRESIEHPQTKHALQNLFAALTDNGRFALLKGILAHLSTPLHSNLDSLGILLRPIVPVAEDGVSSEAVVIVHDIIMPATEAYRSAIQLPDARFMAIQTIDSVVRHISSVFTCISDILEPLCNGDGEKNGKVRKRHTPRLDGEVSLPQAQQLELVKLCGLSPGLIRTLNHATEVILDMWDDHTLQVGGSLCDTLNEILLVHRALVRYSTLAPREFALINAHENAFGIVNTLQRILCMPNERRGKYQALLGLLDAFSFAEFVSVLQKHYSKDDGTISEVQSLCLFSRMLLCAVCNNKNKNIVGIVFAKVVSRACHLDDTALSGEALFMGGVIEPLVKSLLVPGYASPLDLHETSCLANIVTCLISPCIKSEEMFLSVLLSQLVPALESRNNVSRVNYCILEILYRARLVGRDISAHIHPSSRTFQVLLTCLQTQETELRYTALDLCVVSTKMAERVTLWQCRMMEWYISTNMHCGGDSPAMHGLLEAFKKWMRRLTESYGSKGTKEKKRAKGCETIEEYKQLVVDHCVRLVSCIIPQIGESSKWCLHLSLERRVAAMSLYTYLLQSALGFLPATQVQEIRDQLFPPVLVESLLVCLLEGWEKARSCAFNLLILYSDYAPESLFSHSALGHPETAGTAKEKLQRARTHREAEGYVLHYVLATHFTPAARQAVVDDPLQECEQRVKFLEQEMGVLREKVLGVRALGMRQVCEFIQRYPLHGSLSLCTALLSRAWEMKRDAHVFLYEACNSLLRCCTDILQLCSRLVGDVLSSKVNGDETGVEVDCRGHVFKKDDGFSEHRMRTVVNNTWLSIRASVTAVETVMGLVKVEDLSFSVIREICYVLIESLLRTKHNGVMRKVQQALRTVCAALLRSRDAAFYVLPGEMLDLLLGSEGVTSGNVARMLRRSQGLPHAIVAVLEAEDTTVPLSLFPKTMKVLLRVATGAHMGDGDDMNDMNDETSRSQRSNALNVLKFIFENKTFASRSVASLEEAFWIAASGFDDSTWGIRNSSLMLFSAVLTRFVGEHSPTGSVGVNTSLHKIALRAPHGVSFAYEELLRSCASSTPRLGVFPLLQMLSMLTPEQPHASTSAATPKISATTNDESSRVIRAVRRCGASKNLMIRAASGVTLTSLVSPAHLEDFLTETVSVLSNAEADMNAVHGALLHMQQFHSCYVGTLTRNVRAKSANKEATSAMAALVNRLTVEGLGAALLSSSTSKLHHACVHCPTVASAFLGLASDALYFGQNDKTFDNTTPLVNLARLGVAVFHKIACAPTHSYAIARQDHTAVSEHGTFFALVAIRLLLFLNHEVVECAQVSVSVWDALREIFASKNGESLLLHFMEHASYYTVKGRWSFDESQRIMRQFTVNIHCDLTNTALRFLVQELTDGLLPQKSSCAVALRIRGSLEFLVTLCSDDDLHSDANEALCVRIEDLLLGQMDPDAGQSLRNTDVQSWATRFLGRCCVHRGVASEAFLKILAHYSQPFLPPQNRVAVATALKNGLLSCHEKNEEDCGNIGVTQRCAFLLILLRLLFDDAHDVRVESCRVASQLTLPDDVVLDHMTCVLSVVYHLRQYGMGGAIDVAMVRQYLLTCEALEKRVACGADGDNDDDDDSDDDDDDSSHAEDLDSGEGGVLFEREADNMFAENAVLAYLVKVILRDEKSVSPNFGVFDDLLHVAEQRGGAVLLYATLFDDKLLRSQRHDLNTE